MKVERTIALIIKSITRGYLITRTPFNLILVRNFLDNSNNLLTHFSIPDPHPGVWLPGGGAASQHILHGPRVGLQLLPGLSPAHPRHPAHLEPLLGLQVLLVPLLLLLPAASAWPALVHGAAHVQEI